MCTLPSLCVYFDLFGGKGFESLVGLGVPLEDQVSKEIVHFTSRYLIETNKT